MTDRVQVTSDSIENDGGLYFDPDEYTALFSTGCTLLDCVLAGPRAAEGAYPEGRIVNIIGDKSTGKTLLAQEALFNFSVKHPAGHMLYREAEAAFDIGYARRLMGSMIDKVDFGDGPIYTVEEWYDELLAFIKKCKGGNGIYILDSLDALSDKAERDRGIGDATYGASKPKQVGQLFRRLVQEIEDSKVTVIIISQVRDNIGVSFGDGLSRSGGRALDFYASWCLWLAHLGQWKVTRQKVERTIGVNVRAKCKKNKISEPFRDCDFTIRFGFGVDDVKAGLEWLVEVGENKRVGLSQDDAKKLAKNLDKLSDIEYAEERKNVNQAVIEAWREVESRFAPSRTKYGV